MQKLASEVNLKDKKHNHAIRNIEMNVIIDAKLATYLFIALLGNKTKCLVSSFLWIGKLVLFLPDKIHFYCSGQ